MEGPAVVTSPPGTNPLNPNSSSDNHQLKKDPQDLDDFVLELDEAEINGTHDNAESTDIKNERVLSDAENSISNSEPQTTSEPTSTPILPISHSENSLDCEKLENDLQKENKIESIHCEKVVNELEYNESSVRETVFSETENKSENIFKQVVDNPLPRDEPMEVADNFDSVDQELDSLLNNDEEKERKVFDNGFVNLPKVEVGEELYISTVIKDEKSEILVNIKKEDSCDSPVDNPSLNGIINDAGKTEENKYPDSFVESMDVSLNETNYNVGASVKLKTSDFIKESMEIPLNGTKINTDTTEDHKTSVIDENKDIVFNGTVNDSVDTSELTNKITKDISCEEKPSDPEESNGESGKENRKKRMAEVDRKKNAKKIKMSTDSVPNGVSGSIVNGLHEDSQSSGQGNDSDNSEGESMSNSSSDDSIIDYIPEKKNVKKKEFTKKQSSSSKSFILNKSKSSANPEIYQKSRAAVAESPFKDSRTLTVDGNMMEELVMMKVVEFLTVGSQNEKKPPDNAGIYKKCKIEEDKMLALQKRIHDLTKQVEDCKHIIKKLIEEKVSAQPWTNNTAPLRVTRSVGLQVCTVGSVNVIQSRSKDIESVKQLLSASKQEPQDSKDDLIFIGEQTSGSKGKETSAAASSASTVLPPATPSLPTTKGPVNRTSLVNADKKASESIVTSTAPNRSPKPPSMVKIPPSTTPDSSSGKRDSTGNVIMEKKPPPKVSACIDLTDSDDIPAMKLTTPRVGAAAKTTPVTGGISSRLQSGQLPTDRVGGKSSQPLGSSLKSGSNGCKVPNSTMKLPMKNSSGPGVARGNGLSTTPSGTSNSSSKSNTALAGVELRSKREHLPDLPVTPTYPPEFSKPPQPILRIGRNTTGTSGKQGIMLSWNFPQGEDTSEISEYQLYAYQENGPEKTQDSWKKVGDIKALPLPMACFLTQFVEGHKYHFAVRAVDQRKRVGEFSEPGYIILNNTSSNKDEDGSEVLNRSSNASYTPDPAMRTKDN